MCTNIKLYNFYIIFLLNVWILPNYYSFGKFMLKTKNGRQSDDDNNNEDGSVSLGSFESHAHGVSGEVKIMDDRTIEISGLNYDGLGPAAWFMLGRESRSSLPEFTDLEGTVIPDENESCDTLGRYSDNDIKLKMPSNMKVNDFTYLSIYCLRFNHNFGYVTIPSDMKLKNGTVKAGLEKCPDDEIAEAEQEDTGVESEIRRPAGGRPPPGRPQEPEKETGIVGLIDRVVDLLG